ASFTGASSDISVAQSEAPSGAAGRFDHFRAADLQLRARAPSSSPPWSRAELMRKGRVRFNPPVCEPAAEPILVSSATGGRPQCVCLWR
ncbi:unnamed protein product, partial [Symbiodinium sp. CCMP2592]